MKVVFRNVNFYHLINPDETTCVVYTSVAKDEEHVKQLARDRGVDIEGLEIITIRKGMKDQLGKPVKPCFEAAF